MEALPTEWEYTADVAGWINQILSKNPRLPFSEAKCERRTVGSQKRRDITLLDKNKVVALTGEVKLPYKPDGGSPYNEAVVQDARKKAKRAKAEYFFTWNVNECVLWETFPLKTERQDRIYKSWKVTNIAREEYLMHPMTVKEVKQWLPVFLEDFENILRGKIQIGLQSPDEKFIEALESALQMPINLTLEKLVEQYENKRFKSKLDKWMREDQGWLISDDPAGVKDNLERASKFACYALVNKLVFYEAMLKRYASRLQIITVPADIEQGDELRLYLESFFAIAKEETGDYETVFGLDHKEIGNLIPFYSDRAVVPWRELINQIHQFDFSKLDYDVIGNIFERLISPQERHKYGQYYTRPEVVDLINSFCILSGDEKIMDPGCGGGTFLVRAYARKKELMPARKHSDRLLEIFGIDISHFATHLTTINLATRDLIDEENYPQIARSDFFDVKPDKPFLQLPNHSSGAKVKTKGLGKTQQREVEIPLLDAVIGNPPYVRQEDIRRSKKKNKIECSTKEYYAKLIESEWKGTSLSGRSDLHCYFWPHAATFLKEDGYLCLLTSSQWLDVEYGFRLQEWFLRNFRILAVFESIVEPWFIGARVVTAVTILQRETDESARMDNDVRFVQLRRHLSEILLYNGTSASVITVTDEFRDEILALKRNSVNERYRARLVRQGDLWDEGVKLGFMMRKNKDDGNHEIHGEGFRKEKYFGGKWGIQLRAPDFWFQLCDEFSEKLRPLGEIANVKYGIKTGKDSFFLPRDRTSEILEKNDNAGDFEAHYRVSRSDVESGKYKLIECGRIFPIEATYVEPEIHSLMGINEFVVDPSNCSRLIFLVNKSKKSLKGSRAQQYIEWGESQGYHRLPSCVARAATSREWYDITGSERPPIVLPIIQQYRLFTFLNPSRLIINHALLGLYEAPTNLTVLLCGILNSTISILSRLLHARILGNEGNIQLDVYSAKMMLVPDFANHGSDRVLNKIVKAFQQIQSREAYSFISERRLRKMAYTQAGKAAELENLSDLCELDMKDRRELDDAIFEMLGVSSEGKRQKLIDQMYSYIRDHFERTRQKEEMAIENKKKAKRRCAARPLEIAVQILNEIKENEPELLRNYHVDFLNSDNPFDVLEIPEKGEPDPYSDMFTKHAVKFVKGKKSSEIIETRNDCQATLTCLAVKTGCRGLVRVPRDAKECKRVLKSYSEFIEERDNRLWKFVEERTADEDIQEKILESLLLIIRK